VIRHIYTYVNNLVNINLSFIDNAVRRHSTARNKHHTIPRYQISRINIDALTITTHMSDWFERCFQSGDGVTCFGDFIKGKRGVQQLNGE